MVREISLVQYNFKIIDFTSIIKEVSNFVLKDIEVYNLIEVTKLSRDIKRLITHHTIHQVCEVLLKKKNKVPYILFYSEGSYSTELHKHFGADAVNDYLNNLVSRMRQLLPVRIFVTSLSFNTIKIHIDCNSGEGIEFLTNIKNYSDNFDNVTFTFSKIKNYAKRNGLTFLDEDYFNQLKTKQLLFA